jgi:hypothetical protein
MPRPAISCRPGRRASGTDSGAAATSVPPRLFSRVEHTQRLSHFARILAICAPFPSGDDRTERLKGCKRRRHSRSFPSVRSPSEPLWSSSHSVTMAEHSNGDFRRRDRIREGTVCAVGHRGRSGLSFVRSPIVQPTCQRAPSRNRLTRVRDLMARFPPMDGTVKKWIDHLMHRSILRPVTLAIHQRH